MGEPGFIMMALETRKSFAENALAESVSLLDDWKRLHRNSEIAHRDLKADDNPSNPPDRKAYIKAWIDHFARALRLAKASVDFEMKRTEGLRAEMGALAAQIEAGR